MLFNESHWSWRCLFAVFVSQENESKHSNQIPQYDYSVLLLLPIMSVEEVAKAFVQHYYQCLDSNVDQLAGLFVRDKPIVKLRSALVCEVIRHVRGTGLKRFQREYSNHRNRFGNLPVLLAFPEKRVLCRCFALEPPKSNKGKR